MVMHACSGVFSVLLLFCCIPGGLYVPLEDDQKKNLSVSLFGDVCMSVFILDWL